MSVAFVVSACSILAPSEDDYVGGRATSGGGASGNAGVGASGGDGGTGGAGGSASGAGGVAGIGGTGGTGPGGTSSSGAGAGGTSAGGTGAGGTGAGGTGTGGTGTGGTGAGGSGGTSAGGTGAAGSGGTGATGSCVSGTKPAVPQTVVLYALLDRTSSVASGPWALVEQGISAYVDSSAAAGSAIGLEYWPSGGICSGAGFTSPAVPFGLLPGNASAIKSSLANPPSAGSANPLDGVFQGGVSACKSYVASNPTSQCSLVVVTDYGLGSNNTCGSSTGALAGMLQSARESVPSVLTYVVELPGSSGSVLDQFSQAGRGEPAIDVSTSGDVENAFRTARTPCQYDWPTSSTGGVVTWKINANALTEVNGPAACNTSSQYFVTSTAAVLCPETCAILAQGSNAALSSTVTCN